MPSFQKAVLTRVIALHLVTAIGGCGLDKRCAEFGLHNLLRFQAATLIWNQHFVNKFAVVKSCGRVGKSFSEISKHWHNASLQFYVCFSASASSKRC
jgi:hypothetical protein